MPRRRNPENKHLPERWQQHHGAYFYQVPAGLESLWDGKRKFRLGKTLPEAYAEWARRLERNDQAKTIGALLDKYGLRVVPTKAPSCETVVPTARRTAKQS